MDNYTFVSLEAVIEELAELCLHPEEHDTEYSDIEARVAEGIFILNNIKHWAATKYLSNSGV
jgi:hypothetical protein